MLTEQNAREVIGTTAYSADGDKIGKVGQLFLDDQTGRPEFVTVNTGLFGNKETFIPVSDATFNGDRLTLPFGKDQVKDAPNVDAEGGHLDQSEERRLYDYYGMSYDKSASDTGYAGNAGTVGAGGDRGNAGIAGTSGDSGTLGNETRVGTGGTSGDSSSTGTLGNAGTGGTGGTEGYDTSGPTTDDAMTRSEETLRVGTTSQEAGRARLRKYVTTEQETHTVPVRKEKAVLETEPITDANVADATSGPDLSDEEHEVVLNEERVVIDKEVTPVERVRLGTETVTEEETVTDEVRKEHIEAEGDVNDRR
ncbi:MAG: hypothetical protein QOF53_3909 [Nocardioidaceae bacterium]|jgi:uncharacterized protein (TIGR02271 family)|nr:hypothetical protein [Nocardioidaceae bacterium]